MIRLLTCLTPISFTAISNHPSSFLQLSNLHFLFSNHPFPLCPLLSKRNVWDLEIIWTSWHGRDGSNLIWSLLQSQIFFNRELLVGICVLKSFLILSLTLLSPKTIAFPTPDIWAPLYHLISAWHHPILTSAYLL